MDLASAAACSWVRWYFTNSWLTWATSLKFPAASAVCRLAIKDFSDTTGAVTGAVGVTTDTTALGSGLGATF